MKQTQKQQWINALRTGDYQQRTGSGYCALGVLTQIMNQGAYLPVPQWVQGELFPADDYYSADEWDEWDE